MQRRHAWLFMAPALLLIVGFLAYPLARSLFLALHQTAGPANSAFVGTGNLRYLLNDPQFWTALSNSLLYAVAFVVLQLALALALALILEQRGGRFASAIRLLVFIPHLIGAVFAAMIAGKILHRDGPLNALLGLQVDWLGNPATALAVLVAIALWMSVGFAVVYLQAALQSVDHSLIDAAKIDGANRWQRFRIIIWPTIRPTLMLVALIGTIAALQAFELPYLLTGGGPGNRTLTMGLYLYQQGFEHGNLGYAAAVGWAMAVIVGLAGLFLAKRQVTATP